MNPAGAPQPGPHAMGPDNNMMQFVAQTIKSKWNGNGWRQGLSLQDRVNMVVNM